MLAGSQGVGVGVTGVEATRLPVRLPPKYWEGALNRHQQQFAGRQWYADAPTVTVSSDAFACSAPSFGAFGTSPLIGTP